VTRYAGKLVCLSMPEMDLYDLDHKVLRLRERGWTGANRSALIRAAVASIDVEAIEIVEACDLAPIRVATKPAPPPEAPVSRILKCARCKGEFRSSSRTRVPARCVTCRGVRP